MNQKAIRRSPRPDLASAPDFREQRTGSEAYDAIHAGEEGVAGLGGWRHRERPPNTQLESPRAPAVLKRTFGSLAALASRGRTDCGWLGPWGRRAASGGAEQTDGGERRR